jgi:hypothetical protein
MVERPNGCIALDERGTVGIIVDHFGGTCVGFAMGEGRRRWSSHRPRIVGTVVDWVRSRQPLDEWVKERVDKADDLW